MNLKKILFGLILGAAMVQAMKAQEQNLFEIISSGNVPVLKTYLQDHPEVNLLVDKDFFGKFALHVAVEDQFLNPNPDMIAFLLDKGADVNSLDTHKQTPLLMAILRYEDALSNSLYDDLSNDKLIQQLKKRGCPR